MKYLTCYYAHCVAIYGTPQEERDMETLRSLRFSVTNPNSPETQAAYPERGMDMFREMVLDCQVFAFRGNPDGSIPAGVAKELRWAQELGKIIIELPCGTIRRSLDLESTREFLHDCGQR